MLFLILIKNNVGYTCRTCKKLTTVFLPHHMRTGYYTAPPPHRNLLSFLCLLLSVLVWTLSCVPSNLTVCEGDNHWHIRSPLVSVALQVSLSLNPVGGNELVKGLLWKMDEMCTGFLQLYLLTILAVVPCVIFCFFFLA